jgi:hypothetical protein
MPPLANGANTVALVDADDAVVLGARWRIAAPHRKGAGDVKHRHVRGYARAAAAQTADRDAGEPRSA